AGPHSLPLRRRSSGALMGGAPTSVNAPRRCPACRKADNGDIAAGRRAGRRVRDRGKIERGKVMDSSTVNVVVWVVLGVVIAWLAIQSTVSGALGGTNDILASMIGAVWGGLVFPIILPSFLNLAFQQSPLLSHIVYAAVGAVIATFAARAFVDFSKRA